MQNGRRIYGHHSSNVYRFYRFSSCDETDEDKWCKRTGIGMMAGGFTVILYIVIYSSATRALHPKFPLGMLAGFCLLFVGYLLHQYYRSKISAWKKQQRGQEHEVEQESTFHLSPAMILDNQQASPVISDQYLQTPCYIILESVQCHVILLALTLFWIYVIHQFQNHILDR